VLTYALDEMVYQLQVIAQFGKEATEKVAENLGQPGGDSIISKKMALKSGVS